MEHWTVDTRKRMHQDELRALIRDHFSESACGVDCAPDRLRVYLGGAATEDMRFFVAEINHRQVRITPWCSDERTKSAASRFSHILNEQYGMPEGPFDFAAALRLLKRGERVQRTGWNGRGMYVEMQRPDAGSKMTLPYLFMRTVQGDLVPWLISQTDALAEDWILYSEKSDASAI